MCAVWLAVEAEHADNPVLRLEVQFLGRDLLSAQRGVVIDGRNILVIPKLLVLFSTVSFSDADRLVTEVQLLLQGS